MSYVRMLKACHGDALLLQCTKGRQSGTIVVDGGAGTNRRFNEFIDAADALAHVDLMVLTHPDSDHIDGILHYVETHAKDKPFPVSECWANCAPDISIHFGTDLSAGQASTLSVMLEEISRLNPGFMWRSDVTAAQVFDFPFAKLTVLTPTPASLANFIDKYRTKTGHRGAGQEVVNTAAKRSLDFDIPMPQLALRPTPAQCESSYNLAANASSLSFIVECDDMTGLMLADTFQDDVCLSLRALGYSETNRLKADFVKVSHHGSSANTGNELLSLIDCDTFLFSTNGGKGRSYHPERETIARILCHPARDYGKNINLLFNYSREEIESSDKWLFNVALDTNLGFSALFNECFLNFSAHV